MARVSCLLADGNDLRVGWVPDKHQPTRESECLMRPPKARSRAASLLHLNSQFIWTTKHSIFGHVYREAVVAPYIDSHRGAVDKHGGLVINGLEVEQH